MSTHCCPSQPCPICHLEVAESPGMRLSRQEILRHKAEIHEAISDTLEECERCPPTSWELSLWDRLYPGEDFA